MNITRKPKCLSSPAAYGSRRPSRHTCVSVFVKASSQRGDNVPTILPVLVRRIFLLNALSGMPVLLAPKPASADVLKEALRLFMRPEVSAKDAVVILLDAKSTLKMIQGIAATPANSEERFRARAFWPAYAKCLRAVAEAAPVVAGLVTGASDKEETLSEYYGGKAQGAGMADAIYQGIGRVLTISGRTIRPEAQAAPDAAAGAEHAIDKFLHQVPSSLLADAQHFRLERAKATVM